MFSFARLSPVLLSLVLLMPASIVFAEDDEPPVLHGEDAARANQPIDPVQVEKMAAEVRQVPLTEDMVDRFIALVQGDARRRQEISGDEAARFHHRRDPRL